MTLLHLGESVFTAANDHDTRKLEPWCRYSATCYKVRTPMHTVTPLNGKQYTDGCPRDEAACVSAQIVNGQSSYKATDEDKRAEAELKKRRPCRWCGKWFNVRRKGKAGSIPVYCSDECRKEAVQESKRRSMAKLRRERGSAKPKRKDAKQ